MSTSPERDLLLELQDLIVGTESVAEFLGGFASIAAGVLSRSANETIECGVTLKRIKRTATVGGSSPKAIHLDQIEQRVGDGPCIAALRTGVPTLLGDVRTDPRWPEYQKVLYDEGILSALGVPLQLGEDTAAALNFFATSTGVFTADIMREATSFADLAGSAVRLAVKVGTAQGAADDLTAAMASRTAIDLACGIIMGQNRCSQAEAMTILTNVSSHRNQKLRDIAEEMVLKVSGGKASTHFDA
ncbi:GAF and ANTAR domain-containing protein [Arthrobacter sp. S39]|uniref:GAF and ANTAR domain-containing protein n=1 Tax=Arthrobacter sp. S39 TaxID=2509720 RepID=UPI00103818EE|nr:GAF and ANTAR domain-containing protein [Arthrobacter sp. S39]TAP39946.1 ANTAR domain-containing protein [Arthrobacter sp. S39]